MYQVHISQCQKMCPLRNYVFLQTSYMRKCTGVLHLSNFHIFLSMLFICSISGQNLVFIKKIQCILWYLDNYFLFLMDILATFQAFHEYGFCSHWITIHWLVFDQFESCTDFNSWNLAKPLMLWEISKICLEIKILYIKPQYFLKK